MQDNGIKGLFEVTVKNVLWLVLVYVELLAIALHDKLLGYIERNCNHLNLVLVGERGDGYLFHE